MAIALYAHEKVYAQTTSGLSELIKSYYVQNCLTEGKPPLQISGKYCIRHKLLTAQERGLVMEFLETPCLGNLPSIDRTCFQSPCGSSPHGQGASFLAQKPSIISSSKGRCGTRGGNCQVCPGIRRGYKLRNKEGSELLPADARAVSRCSNNILCQLLVSRYPLGIDGMICAFLRCFLFH